MVDQFQRNKVASALALEKYIKSNEAWAAYAKDKNVILLPKSFWSTENFQSFWDHWIEQFFQTVKGQNNVW